MPDYGVDLCGACLASPPCSFFQEHPKPRKSVSLVALFKNGSGGQIVANKMQKFSKLMSKTPHDLETADVTYTELAQFRDDSCPETPRLRF
jgi:hypothetical protein